MELLIMLFPMLIDQFKAMGQDVYTQPAPVFGESAKVKPGMTVAALLKQLGTPKDVSDTIMGDKMLSYRGEMCSMQDENCYVFINKGLVTELKRIKPQYMAGI
jgi:hypothetical protein